MDRNNEGLGLLDLMTRPGFYVKENRIVQCNAAAEALLITPGTDVRTLLTTGAEEYEAFRDGCLCLRLNLGCSAFVSRAGDSHVFLLEPDADEGELRALSLAARELRQELSSLMVCVNILSSLDADDQTRDQLARLNRSIHRIQRTLGNMSDAGSCAQRAQMEMVNLPAVLAEIFEKAGHYAALSGATLEYKGLKDAISCPADSSLLERAVLNILSNALKFAPQGCTIRASLTRRGRMLQLQIRDNGPGIPPNILPSLFFRYQRQPGIEDSRQGIGLGMVLVRSAATVHGGTVLIDRPKSGGTRVTLTLAIRQSTCASLRCPIMRVDYAGEQDHALVELAEVLPIHVYEKK